MMKKRKLGIIGGSGLYKMNGFEKTKWKKINTPWGKPSDEILLAKLGKEEICFIPRHSRGHKINPTNINFRANIDAMKQLGITDIISVSAVGSLKENLEENIIDNNLSGIKLKLKNTINNIKLSYQDREFEDMWQNLSKLRFYINNINELIKMRNK